MADETVVTIETPPGETPSEETPAAGVAAAVAAASVEAAAQAQETAVEQARELGAVVVTVEFLAAENAALKAELAELRAAFQAHADNNARDFDAVFGRLGILEEEEIEEEEPPAENVEGLEVTPVPAETVVVAEPLAESKPEKSKRFFL